MIKVSPLIETNGTNEYKNFINKEFKLSHLSNYDNSSTHTLFGKWEYEAKPTHHMFKYDIYKLCFYETNYMAFKEDELLFNLPLPNTITQFIGDMHRFNIILYWTMYIDEILEPKDYLPSNKVRNYYKKLLYKIEKGYELLE